MSTVVSRARRCAALLGCAALAGPSGLAAAADDAARAQETRFREIYRELVETDTSLSSGNCTRAAEQMAARLVRAGHPGSRVRVVVPERFPRQGNLVADMPGTDPGP